MSNVVLIYQQFIHKSRYARWLEEQRREEWHETVSRYMNYMRDSLKAKHGYKFQKSSKKCNSYPAF